MRTSNKLKALIGGGLCIAAILGFGARANAVGIAQIQVGEFAIEKGVFNTIFAKELCSCQFVDGLSLEDCEARDNLPSIAHSLVNLTVDPDTQTVSSSYKGADEINGVMRSLGLSDVLSVGGSASAHIDRDHPEWGCVLTQLPSDPAADPPADPPVTPTPPADDADASTP